MNMQGRIAACGMISRYNDKDGTPQPGPHNLFLVVGKRIRMQGFIVSDHAARRDDSNRDVGQWIRAGRVKWQETDYKGMDRPPEAFLYIPRGDKFGEMVVRVSTDRTCQGIGAARLPGPTPSQRSHHTPN